MELLSLMSNKTLFNPFRTNIIKALERTTNDADLRRELHRLLLDLPAQEKPALLTKPKKKTLH